MTGLLVKYILTAALRDRLLLSFIVLVGLGLSVSVFLGSAALTEKDQFSLVFAAGGLRIAGLLTLILFVVFYLRRSFETRDVEYILSRPISRFQFLLAHSIAFNILATFIAVSITLAVSALSYQHLQSGHLLWGVSFWVELLVMANVALFFALFLSSAVTAALVSFAFYILSRLIGDILGIIEKPGEAGTIAFLEKIMNFVSIFIPRLDLMGQTSWLLYGTSGEVNFTFLFLQGAIFCGFILAAAYYDLSRRQF